MGDLTVAGMRVVREVAALGSFTAAARALGYTQPAVSRQVAQMEQAAGAPLFERLARGVRPTPAGDAFLRHARAILDRVEAAELDLGERRDALAGRVRLGAFPTALHELVPRALARLRDEHPGVEVVLREAGSPAQLRRLRSGRLDAAIVAFGAGLDYDLAQLRADRLLHGEFRIAVGERHPFAGRAWVGLAELRGQRWIVGDADTDGPVFGAWPTLDETPDVAFAVRELSARLGFVAAGAGIAVVPMLGLGALPRGVHVARVDDPAQPRREVLAVTAPDRATEVDAVVAALRQEGEELAASRR